MANTREFGLIGNPLEHSFSKDYFSEKFKREGIDAEYNNFELPDIGDIMELIAESPNLEGFNVTSPFKEAIIPYLDEKDSMVDRIGACNLVKIERTPDGDLKFIGSNTDYFGFMNSLRDLCFLNNKALILGTGGASKAVEAVLADLGFTALKVSRQPTDGQLSYQDLNECINDYFLIVNCTPLGTYPNVNICPDIPFDIMDSNHLCYDLVYNPAVTEFMRRSANKGAMVKNGLAMLIGQAERSWEIWNS